jgi:hypothetical protein
MAPRAAFKLFREAFMGGSMQNSDWTAKATMFATLLAALAALGAVGMNYLQIKASTEIQREATARQLFLDVLKYTTDNPTLGCTSSGHPFFKIDRSTHAILERSQDYAKYVAYVEYMLRAMESALEFIPADNETEWRYVVLGRISCHSAYLASEEFKSTTVGQGYCSFSPKMQELLNANLLTRGSARPSCSSK